MLRTLLILSLLSSVFAGAVRQPEHGRINGGGPADPGEYPFQLALLYQGIFYGAATVISPNWALSAGHALYGVPTSDVTILAGTNNLTLGGSIHRTLRFITHEEYFLNSTYIRNDIGLIEVADPFVLSDLLQPVKLPLQDESPQAGDPATAIGWGLTEDSGIVPDLIQEVGVEIEDQQKCVDKYASHCGVIEAICEVLPHMICSIKQQDAELGGICKGDSGGPLLADGVQVGISSFAMLCGDPSYPSVFTRVATYRDWITQHTGV